MQIEDTSLTQAESHELLQQNESFVQIALTQVSHVEERTPPVVQAEWAQVMRLQLSWQIESTSPMHWESHEEEQQNESAAQTFVAHGSHDATRVPPVKQIECAQAVVPVLIVHVIVALCVIPPLVPVTVTVYVPAAAVPADSVSVEVPPDATLAELKLLEAPAGTPLAVSATVPANPPLPAIEMLEVLDAPAAVVNDPGLVDRLKSCAVVQPETELPGKQISSTG